MYELKKVDTGLCLLISPNNGKTKLTKLKSVVYLIHFMIDICARHGVLHLFFPRPPKQFVGFV